MTRKIQIHDFKYDPNETVQNYIDRRELVLNKAMRPFERVLTTKEKRYFSKLSNTTFVDKDGNKVVFFVFKTQQVTDYHFRLCDDLLFKNSVVKTGFTIKHYLVKVHQNSKGLMISSMNVFNVHDLRGNSRIFKGLVSVKKDAEFLDKVHEVKSLLTRFQNEYPNKSMFELERLIRCVYRK